LKDVAELIDACMDGPSEMYHRACSALIGENYYRIQPALAVMKQNKYEQYKITNMKLR